MKILFNKLSLIIFFSLFLLFLLNQGLELFKKHDIVIGSKNFTESRIIAEIYAIALEKAGYKVEKKLNLAGTLVAHEALKAAKIDLYPEYTGTALLNILNLPPVKDEQKAYKIISKMYLDKYNLVWLKPAPANNSQGLVITGNTSDKYKLTSLSQLSQLAPMLKLASTPEFIERDDGLKGLKRTYGNFIFKYVKIYDNGIKYRILKNNLADVLVGFTTDGELQNKYFIVLKDDKAFWISYHSAPVVRNIILKKHPEIVKILDNISEKLTDNVLQKLNAEADIKKRDYRAVAYQFLLENKLIKD